MSINLYYILDIHKDEIIAITEYREDICRFFIQNGYSYDDYKIIKSTKKKRNEKYLRRYMDLYLQEYGDYIIREIEFDGLTNIINDTRKTMKESYKDLEYIKSVGYLSKKDKKAFKRVMKVLKTKRKPYAIDNFLGTDQIIQDYYNIPKFQDQIIRLDQDFKFHIYNEEE